MGYIGSDRKGSSRKKEKRVVTRGKGENGEPADAGLEGKRHAIGNKRKK